MDELEEFFKELAIDGFVRYPKSDLWNRMMSIVGEGPTIILMVERHGERIRGIVQTSNFHRIAAMIGLGSEHCFEIFGNMDRRVIFPVRLDRYTDKEFVKRTYIARIIPGDGLSATKVQKFKAEMQMQIIFCYMDENPQIQRINFP